MTKIRDEYCGLIVYFAAVIILVVFAFIYSSCDENKRISEITTKINQYNSIVVNGETYDTDNIVHVNIEPKSYAPDIVVLRFEDGTLVEVPEGNYTFKD
jgi:uncharacterized membrane protein YjfL (UPF0719 family)